MTLHQRFLPIVRCLLLTVLFLPTAFGQSATATLSGTVEDQNGAVIPGVGITIQNIATSFERQVTSNDSGSFTIPLLPPGTYTVTARREGFTPVEISNVVLNVGDQKALQIQLKAGSITELVKITDDASLIDESPAVATVVDRQFVANLPLNGRSFQSLITLTPGVVLTKTTGTEAGQFSVNGQRASANYFTVDGVSANFGSSSSFVIGQSVGGSLPGLTAFGGTNNLVSVDALEEFKIQTSSYAPEFGRQPGGQISIVTRSGTNDFHGTLFEYLRNDVFDANDWFANRAGLKRPPLRMNQFGGVVGGPIIKNKTFFFFSYEGLRLRQPTVAIVQVPSLAVRQSAPASLRPYLNAFPRPTAPDMPNGFAELAASYSDPTTLNATSIRLDHTVSKRLTLFGRYNYAPSNTGQRSNSLSTLTTGNADTRTVTAGATFIFSTDVSNDLRANYSGLTADTSSRLDDFGGAVVPPDAILFPSGITSQDSVYTLTITGGTSPGLGVGTNATQQQRQVNLVDNLSVVTGPHQLKFGIDYRRLTPIYAPRKYIQIVTFAGIGITAPGVPPPAGSVLSGRVRSGSVTAQADAREPVFTNLSLYGQDTWRVNRRLTLTYGLRWEANPAPHEQNGNEPFTIIGLANPATATLGPRDRPYKTTYNNLAPRFGVAYQLSQRTGRETIIRGGIGLFHDLGYGTIGNAYGGFPFTTTRSLPQNTIYPLDPALAAPPTISLNPANATLNIADPDLELPRVYQWNFAIEQSLGSNQTMTASYVAALGRSLLRLEDIRFTAGTNPTLGSGILRVTRNLAESDYHAMQLLFQRRLSSGLQALVSYTWGNSIDNASNDSTFLSPGDKLDPLQDRGPSDFDVRHSFNAALTYDLPKIKNPGVVRTILGGWSVDTIVNARTATPVNVFSLRDIGFSFFNFRPDLIPGVPLYLDDMSAPGSRRFNRAAFIIPTESRPGTLGRNAMRGFSFSQVDLALRRQFGFTERLKLQLRFEAFNIFNHPNFADPIADLANVNTFGRSTSMLGRSLGSRTTGLNPAYQVGGPRSLQIAVKIYF